MRSVFLILACLTAQMRAAPRVAYQEVAVFPLPPEPPGDAVEMFGILRETIPTNSLLESTQIALWLQQLPVAQLDELLASIPSPWMEASTLLPGLHEVDHIRIRGLAEFALITHPDHEADPAGRRAAGLRGFETAETDWDEALKLCAGVGDEKIAGAYRVGMLNSALKRTDSFGEFLERANEIGWKTDETADVQLAMRWPISAMSRELSAFPEALRERWMWQLKDEAAWFFADYAEARAFWLQHAGNGAYVRSELGEALAPVIASRSPERFFAWWTALPKSHRNRVIDDATAALLRHDPANAHRILAGGGSRKLRAQWARLDPVAAYGHFKPEGEKDLEKRQQQEFTVALYRRFPALGRAEWPLAHRFDPLTIDPHDYAEAMGMLEDEKQARSAAWNFGRRWGRAEGAVAFEWAMALPDDNPLKREWIRMIVNGWAHEDQEAAEAALDAVPETLIEAEKRGPILSNRYDSHLDRTPAVYKLPPNGRGPAFPTAEGGTGDQVALRRERASLEELAVPDLWRYGYGEVAVPVPVLNAPLVARVLALPKVTAAELVRHYEVWPPLDARGSFVQKLLVERWALDDPRAASEWLIHTAPGSFRSALRLSLSRLALAEPQRAIDLLVHVPDENEYGRCWDLVSRSIAAGAGYARALEIIEPINWSTAFTLSAAWLRHDPEAAQAWRRERWVH